MIKILVNSLVAVFMLSGPLVAKAEDSIVGTDAYALAVDGVPNVFYQGKLSPESAYLIEVAASGGVSIVQASYKHYFGEGYANALYLAGGVLIASGGGTSVTGVMGKVGYDFPVADNVVLSPFYGIGSVAGFSFDGIGFNVGMKF